MLWELRVKYKSRTNGGGRLDRQCVYLTCMAEVLTSNFLKMAKASSKSSLLMAMLAMSGAS